MRQYEFLSWVKILSLGVSFTFIPVNCFHINVFSVAFWHHNNYILKGRLLLVTVTFIGAFRKFSLRAHFCNW